MAPPVAAPAPCLRPEVGVPRTGPPAGFKGRNRTASPSSPPTLPHTLPATLPATLPSSRAPLRGPAVVEGAPPVRPLLTTPELDEGGAAPVPDLAPTAAALADVGEGVGRLVSPDATSARFWLMARVTDCSSFKYVDPAEAAAPPRPPLPRCGAGGGEAGKGAGEVPPASSSTRYLTSLLRSPSPPPPPPRPTASPAPTDLARRWYGVGSSGEPNPSPRGPLSRGPAPTLPPQSLVERPTDLARTPLLS